MDTKRERQTDREGNRQTEIEKEGERNKERA